MIKRGGNGVADSKEVTFVRPIAEESLDLFAQIASAAEKEIMSGTGSGAGSFASINTFTSTEAVKNRSQITDANLESYRILSREPAIARVLVVDEEGHRSTYYFCRAAPVRIDDRSKLLASYRAPIGRLAELSVGDEATVIKNGKAITVEIIEQAKFHPSSSADGWDAKNAILIGDGIGPLTVASLRAALADKTLEIDGDILDALLAEDTGSENIREGVRRGVIGKMALRDQSILDEHQGEIFRFPLNSRLLILGAPGTGKTTTLIRRLGQKLDLQFLDEDERRLIPASSEADHSQSWVMFTPTELLKLYVKEAFNREGIPAPDARIMTWSDFREDLARKVFGILRTSANSSALVMKEGAGSLAPTTIINQIAWFDDFNNWQKLAFWDDLRQAVQRLVEDKDEAVRQVGAKLARIIPNEGTLPEARAVAEILSLSDEIKNLADRMKEVTDRKIRGALNTQVYHNRGFLDELAIQVQNIGDVSEDPDDPDSDDEEDLNQPRIGRAAAMARYFQIMRTLSRSRANKRSIGKATSAGQLLEWLGDRTLSREDQASVGESLIIQSALRSFANPVRRYIDGTVSRYRRFRRARQSEARWYPKQGFVQTDLHPLEVDVILLGILQSSSDLLRTSATRTNDGRAPAALERMESLYRTQVVVDEATDFSPVQLACMAALSRPGFRSFFACGDFNQRVTNWGARSVEDLHWAVPDIQTREITVAYRQSGHLHDLARNLVALSGGNPSDAVLPAYSENEGVPPVLSIQLDNPAAIAQWLGDRITEIEALLGELPSIAVLVNSEEEVRSVAVDLQKVLADHNISVIPCPDGQVRGRDGAVRVFNVQHIKGLEFEAVFFVSVDQLAADQPDLFDKYLYVGATRAATYLGLTCETELPLVMKPLEDLFGNNWSLSAG
jgi:hypothetical protein